MPSVLEQYRSGAHAAAWQALDTDWQEGLTFRAWADRPSSDEVEALMHETFGRVARNIDLLIERLRDTGYRFECESGRVGPAVPPRRPVADLREADVAAALRRRFAALPGLEAEHLALPGALTWFARIVGTVDLRQRFPPRGRLDLPDELDLLGEDEDDDLLESLDFLDALDDESRDDSRLRDLAEEDRAPHPHADDPVLSRLGDWDPLVVEPEMLLADILDPDADWQLVPGGGVGLAPEFAPSFEHKADVSGAVNYHIYLPTGRFDPIVHAERVNLSFLTYLRTTLSRGGFFGVPRPLRKAEVAAQEVSPGIWLPEHPVFASLAADMEPF
ncbi:hypothetical protein ACW9UR_20340 [Halovulum sp. GXIMD14794]